MSYRNVPLDANGQASDPSAMGSYGGYVVIKIECSPAARNEAIEGFVDGIKVIAATAADNNSDSVISSSKQSFTMPVPPGSTWKVVASPGKAVEVRWCARF